MPEINQPKQSEGILNGGLNRGLKSLLVVILKSPGIRPNQISVALDRPIKTIERQIKTLVEKQIIERRRS